MRVVPRLLTYLCYGAMMSLSIALNLLPVFLTTLSATYGGAAGLSQEELGRLGAIAFTGLVLGIAVTGPLADRWGAKPFALLGNLLTSVCLAAAAYAPSYGSLAVALFWLGVAAGILDMVLSPIVAALNPTRRVAAMNWLHAFYCIGAVATILAGTLALRAGFSWRFACLVLLPLPAALAAVLGALAFPALTAEGGRLPARALVRESWFRTALAAIFLGGATELGMAQWLPAYAETELGFPAWVGGAGLLGFSAAMAAGRGVMGSFSKRWDPFLLMAGGGAISVGLFLLGSFLPFPSLALAACVTVGFTGSCLWPTMLAVTADRYPQGGASMYGLLAIFGNAGGIFMPWFVGAIADRSNLRWGLSISALAPIVMCALVLRLRAAPKPA